MKTSRFTLTSLLALALCLPAAVRAADTDIYSSVSPKGDIPNLLIVLDNAANFDASATACSYTDSTTTPTLSGKTGGIEQCALNNVVYGLGTNSDGTAKVNIGIMIYNASGFDKIFTGCQAGGNGGCLIYPLTAMDATGKTNLLSFIKGWTTTGSNSMKSNNEADASTMQEAWAYYAGKTGMSGRVYTTPSTATGCSKNFIIFIGNAWNTSGTPGDSSQYPGTGASPTQSLATVVAANTKLSSAQQTTLTTNIQIPYGAYGTSSFSCGSFTSTMFGTHKDSSGLFLDEWARYAYSTDLSTGSMDTVSKNISTYTIGLLSSACVPEWPALLNSAAAAGGGKYFATSSYSDVYEAILKILNEVQAVNSVFSSSSLPVSVNTQGTYLNQIFMGMFRPDAQGNPRWVGNLKQYQFIVDSSGNLQLGDAAGQPAISSSGTGFLSSNAASYWTCTSNTLSTRSPALLSPYNKLSTCATDPTSGFWQSNSTFVYNSVGGAYDLVDGEVVEKGATAQGIRLTHLTDDYSTTTSSGSTSRHLYTYCPGNTATSYGTGCVADLTDPANVFNTSNTSISSSAFGGVTYINLSSIKESVIGGVATATATSYSAHGLSTGNSITVGGANPTVYNGTYTITVTGTYTFTFPIVEYPPSPATASYQAALHNSSQVPAASITRTYVTSTGTNPTNTQEQVYVDTSPSTVFVVGDSIVISGSGSYDGNYTVSTTGTGYNSTTGATSPCATCFSFVIPGKTYGITAQPPAPSTGTYTVTPNNTTLYTNASSSGITCAKVGGKYVVTVTTNGANGFVTNDYVTIAGSTINGVSASYNGSYYVTQGTSNNQFTYVISSCPNTSGKTLAFGTSQLAATAVTITAGNLTRAGDAYASASPYPNTATATVAASNFATNDSVTITKTSTTDSDGLQYYITGPYTITCASSTAGACTSFTYKINSSPGYPVTGASVSYMTSAMTPQLIIPSGITRTYPGGTTATAKVCTSTAQTGCSGATIPATPGFNTGDVIDISKQSNTTLPSNETYYTGTYTVTCVGTSPCTTFTYGPISLGPSASATGNVATPVSPDRNTLINWVRGQDNVGDELSLCPGGVSSTSASAIPGMNYANCPSTPVTVRPSVHGDVLHSRPVVLNYGGTNGVIVYYGDNGGVYHAVNGNQTNPTSTTLPDPGQELWGFIPSELFGYFNRQRTQLPVLQLPSTPSGISPLPEPKDYSVDGPTGVYQLIDVTSGITQTAYLYLGMRRGGRFMYALDVTSPTKPKVLWEQDYNNTTLLNELGQTWSTPKVIFIDGYYYTDSAGNYTLADGATSSTTPVQKPLLVFGAGYDATNEDVDPPTTDTMGRGIFILDAIDGHVVWVASPNAVSGTNCTSTTWYGASPVPCQLKVANMNYSIPSDLTLMDVDNDGQTDRIYATDVGGNIWRIDFKRDSITTDAKNTPDQWKVTQVAALGCASGACASGTTPRKFLYPVEITSSSTVNYLALMVVSGNREKPLYGDQSQNTCTNCSWSPGSGSYDRFYMIKDYYPSTESYQTTPINESTLFDCTGCATVISGTAGTSTTSYNNSGDGYYVSLIGGGATSSSYSTSATNGEKGVTSPNFTAGFVYFSTNQPAVPSSTSCNQNLGIARSYQIAPFTGTVNVTTFDGGGLPPSPVSGVVTVGNGTYPFCIGCGVHTTGSSTSGGSASQGARPPIYVSSVRKRTYRYIKGK